MEKIKDEDVSTVLQQYGIATGLIDTTYLIENYEKKINPRSRVIVKAETENKESYIIKFILEEEHSQKLIEEQSIFSESIRENGINTPERFMKNGKYCTYFFKNALSYNVTVEKYIGEELNFIDNRIIEEIACLMAKMHNISQTNNLHIQGNTIWDLFDGTSDVLRGYKAFCEYRNDDKYNFNLYNIDLYENIINIYQERFSRIRLMWDRLPKFATQGDYSINNLTYKNGKIYGIFDYNIAGDEVLVSDMIIEGLFVSYEMDLDNSFTDDYKDKMFKLFVKKYMEHRRLNQDEVNIINDLYAVVFPFWWTRIIFDEDNSLKKYLDDNNVEKVNQFLKDTYRILKQDYFTKEDFKFFN